MTGKDRTAILLAGAAVAAVPALAIAQERIDYRYDARGRLVQIVRNLAGAPADVVTNYGFDKADNCTLKNTSGSPNPPPP